MLYTGGAFSTVAPLWCAALSYKNVGGGGCLVVCFYKKSIHLPKPEANSGCIMVSLAIFHNCELVDPETL